MFLRISTVALNAYREAVRARVLLGLGGVAVAVAIYSLLVGAYTLNEAPRVVADLGAATVSVFSIAVAVLIGATSLHRELEMKTILPLLARPIRRSEYLVGKYLGTMLVVGVFAMAECGLVLMMSAAIGGRSPWLVLEVVVVLCLILGVYCWRSSRARTYGPIPWAAAMLLAGSWLCDTAPLARSLLLSSTVLTMMEVAIIAAIATLFSSFSTPFLSSLLTMGAFAIGRSTDMAARLPVKLFGEVMHNAGKVLSVIFPNLHVYVPARPLLTGEALDANLASYLGMAGLQALCWTFVLLTCAALIFQQRDFL